MSVNKAQSRSPASKTPAVDHEVIIIGAGFGGLRALHECRKLGLSARVIESQSDVGGTWYTNRYPGAKTDTESWAYCFTFDKALLDDWDWSQRFPSWNETLRYLQHVADRFDMRRDIQFDTSVTSAVYDEAANTWTVGTDTGQTLTCRFIISATGLLSVPWEPPFKGLDGFKGEWHLTARWPKQDVDFTGKRVAVIGTGATGVQIIPVVAQTAAHLTVFQRTPNYVVPARNHPLEDGERDAIKRSYDTLLEKAHKHYYAFTMDPAGRMGRDLTPEQRHQVLERGWETGGFRYIFETFDDVLTDPACNEAASEFIRNKIRVIVKDPATAELLCPKTHPLGAKRLPLGHYYYETFNRENVSLIDVSDDAIEEITPTGIRTAKGHYEVDVIIFAIGFDAVTGSWTRIDVRGRGGQSLQDKWATGARAYLGMCVDEFPNLFTILGPQSPMANVPILEDRMVDWIGKAITYLRDRGYRTIEPTAQATEAWAKHCNEIVSASVLAKGEQVRSWLLGANIPGKAHGALFYFGGAGPYFSKINHIANHDFEDFVFTSSEPSLDRARHADARATSR